MNGTSSRRSAPLPRDWERTRRQVLKDHGHVCANCPRTANQVDHIVPASEGGSDAYSNLQALCKPCHDKKTGREAARARLRKMAQKKHPPERHPGSTI